eukprot:GHUV01021108.1.p1 GENE.GHUV01021108.1~~GHUV01021108.1.p1  ORF type:complete len:480 (+),score=158.33 GHUV01021108.1:171-1610(+)
MAGRGPGFLQNLKGKITQTFQELKQDLSAPSDPYENRIADHVQRATSELLTGPDWGLNFELIDIINNDSTGTSDKVYRAIRRALSKPQIQSQLLALALLEACVKNCVPFFFQQLMYSDLWQEIIRAGEPFRNWDPEVRDKALGLIEDFARGLPMQGYKEAYEGLLDRGVDFPVRPQADTGGAPYYTPPPMPAATAAAAQGLSPEDRAAIAAAVADLEAQESQRSAAESALAPPGLPSGGHVPAMMGPAVLMGAPIRPPGYSPPPGYHPPHAPAVQPATVAGAAPIDAQHPSPEAAAVVPTNREQVEQHLRVSRNSAELLAEMLAPIKSGGDRAALQETFVNDLVDQCLRYRSLLAEIIPRLSEEDLISGALMANDDLSRVLADFDALVQGLTLPATAAGTAEARPGPSTSAGGAAGPSSSSGGALPGGGASANFTLLDEDEEEGEDLSLQTRRGAVSTAVGAATGTTSTSAGGAPKAGG